MSSLSLPQVGDGIAASRGRWTFGAGVARRFQSHVTRSVPQYLEGHALICSLAPEFLSPGALAYDLGCSTGALTEALLNCPELPNIRVIGVDIEAEMIEHAQARQLPPRARFVHADVTDFCFESAGLFVAYYLFQFLPIEARKPLLQKLFDALIPGGGLFFFEKIRFEDPQQQASQTSMYREFKRSNGYSLQEIEAKTLSLQGVMWTQSSPENRAMLEEVGFETPASILRALCFEGLLARKPRS